MNRQNMLPIQRNNYQTDLNVSPEILNDRRQKDDQFPQRFEGKKVIFK